jgi:protein tyrosine/serine phosphatase
VITALALTVAGAVPEAVIADYAVTSERINAVLNRLIGSQTYAEDAESKPVAAHTPQAETMKAFLEQLEVRYGGLPKWLADNGFSEQEQARLRAALREP